MVGTVLYTGIGISMDHGFSLSTLGMGTIIGVPMGAFLAYRWWEQGS